jgi:hypothetical protein
MQGISGIGYSGYGYPWTRSADQRTAAPSSTTSNSAAGSTAASGETSSGPAAGASPRLSGQNAIAAMLGNGEEVTGGVTATLPDGITIGVWSLAQTGSDQGALSSSSASGSTSASSSAPDYSAMEAALEQMVEQFMSSGFSNQASGSTSAAAAAAQQAYGSQPISADPTAEVAGANVVA